MIMFLKRLFSRRRKKSWLVPRSLPLLFISSSSFIRLFACCDFYDKSVQVQIHWIDSTYFAGIIFLSRCHGLTPLHAIQLNFVIIWSSLAIKVNCTWRKCFFISHHHHLPLTTFRSLSIHSPVDRSSLIDSDLEYHLSLRPVNMSVCPARKSENICDKKWHFIKHILLPFQSTEANTAGVEMICRQLELVSS